MARQAEPPRLKKHENGVWYAHWYVPELKREKRQSLDMFAGRHIETQDQAVQEFAAFLSKGGHKRGSVTGGMTVGEALDLYWEEHAQNSPASASIKTYIGHLRTYFGKVKISDINSRLVNGYREKRAAGQIGRTAAVVTQRTELVFLTAAINHQYKNKRIALSDIPYIPKPATPDPAEKSLTVAEVDRLFIAARDFLMQHDTADTGRLTRMYRFCHIAYFTASRRTAVEELRWGQVDFEGGIIHLNPRWRKQTTKRRPSVAISKSLMPLLTQAHQERGAYEYVLDVPDELYKQFSRCAKQAGIERPYNITPHILRDSRATHLLQQREPIFDVAKLLGDRVATVERYYAHVLAGHLNTLMENDRTLIYPVAETTESG